MRKIILLSDTHLHLDAPLYGWNAWDRLDICLAHIAEHHADASAMCILGDLAQNGDRNSYECAAMHLASVDMPIIAIPGNHDHTEVMEALFPAVDGMTPPKGLSLARQTGLSMTPPKGLGMARQWILPEAQLLFFHTKCQGQSSGAVYEDDAERLRVAMEAAQNGVGNGNVFVFMHHPPLQSGIDAMDAAGLAHSEALLAAAAMVNPVHGPRLSIICGHIHRSIAGRWHGLPVLTLRGLMPEVAFNQDPNVKGFTGLDTPPSYGVLMLGDGSNGDFSSMALHEEFFMEKVANFSI